MSQAPPFIRNSITICRLNEHGLGVEAIDSEDATAEPAAQFTRRFRIYHLPGYILLQIWRFMCLALLLAVVAAIPVVQLASLGYLLESAGRLAQSDGRKRPLPGLELAGKVGVFAALATLTWLPVWFVCDLSYSGQLLMPNTPSASRWRFAAFLVNWCERLAERGYSDRRISLPMPRGDIANHLNLAPETVSRVIRRLIDEGVLAVDRRDVEVLNKSALRSYAASLLQRA